MNSISAPVWLARVGRFILRHAPTLLFLLTLLTFACFSNRFLQVENLVNIVVQAAPTGIVAIGMTFVLLTAGVDLSVGAVMFVTAAIAGKLLQAGHSLALALPLMLLVGILMGGINAFFVTRLKVVAFVATLALLFIGRGFARWLTETRALPLPEQVLELSSVRILMLPLPLVLLGTLALVGHVALTRTALGRQLHAVGQNAHHARQAGLNTTRLTALAYLICGGCAAIGAMVSMGQLGTVSPSFGENYEFKAIAATVLGGTSLFGGRGAILPGTVLGALLMQSIENGLVLVSADPYLYPIITAAAIFTGVMFDSLRHRWLENHRPVNPAADG